MTWLRPGDSAIMSRDYSILSVEGERRRNRLMIIGDFTKGEFHLLIRYTLFPQDAGTWLCTSEPVTHRVNVLLLVRPTTQVRQMRRSWVFLIQNLRRHSASVLKHFLSARNRSFLVRLLSENLNFLKRVEMDLKCIGEGSKALSYASVGLMKIISA